MATRIVILGGGTGGTIMANRLLEKLDIPQVNGILTVGEFYELAAGGEIIFT